ncbi:uncharacterized protein METZ01_LOCUS439799 [marine metagenome]|uniref:Uncharacterized protein n=1 Tax=marine metagenome TaxID=408172 RepID=A0A382YVR5_9ZZZZ
MGNNLEWCAYLGRKSTVINYKKKFNLALSEWQAGQTE